MPGFFLAFLTVLLATMAGREAVRVARLAGAGVSAGGLLLAAAFAGMIYAGLSAVIGDQLAPLLNAKGKLLIVAIALALAACEVLLLRAGKAPREPTLSVGAAALVLAGALMTGAAGLLVMAITLVTGEPVLAGVGGALGALAGLAVPAFAGAQWEARFPQGVMRWITSGLLFFAALITGLRVFVPF